MTDLPKKRNGKLTNRRTIRFEEVVDEELRKLERSGVDIPELIRCAVDMFLENHHNNKCASAD